MAVLHKTSKQSLSPSLHKKRLSSYHIWLMWLCSSRRAVVGFKLKGVERKGHLLEMSKMNSLTRREFLASTGKTSVGLTVGMAAVASGRRTKADAANDRLRLAVVGIHGRGGIHAKKFAARPDCEVAYLCDVDESLFPQYVSEVERIQHRRPKVTGDFRRALDDKSIDAIIVATPDHWHALATIWGCQAGKDVYVEKPVSHSPWEGRKMVEAARRYDRIVQVGTQNRSAHYNKLAKEYIESGKLGTIHMVRVINQKAWPNSPAMADSDPPSGLNWDMWTGPAPESKYNENYHRRLESLLAIFWWRYYQRRRAPDGSCPLGYWQDIS